MSRPWIKSYTHLITDPQFMRLTAGSRCLWYDSNLWCGLNDSEGVIPADAVKNLKGTDSKINGLLKAGFWVEDETDSGQPAYRIVGWLDGQKSVKKVEKEREQNTARQAKSRAKSAPTHAQVEPKSAPTHAQVELKSAPVEAHLNDQNGPDLEEQAGVTPLEKRREEDIRQERDSARPPGGSLPEAETETRDEGGRQETTGCQVIPLPDLSAGTLRDRLSALNEKSGTTKRSESAPVSKPLEKMSPKELLDYMETFHWEVNNIHQDGGQAGISTMKAFQRRYGNERAAAIIRELFVNGGGRYKVGREVEVISYRHFSQGLGWFTDKVDLDLQSKAQREVEVERDFTFASEL